LELLETWIAPHVAFGLLAFSAAVTIFTNWLAARFSRPNTTSPRSVRTLTADVVWISLVFLAGLIAARYIERMPSSALGFAVFGLVMFCLSLGRAALYRRASEAYETGELASAQLANGVVHNLTYILAAVIIYLSFCVILRRPADPLLFIPLCAGALLPDLDSQETLLGRNLRPISRWLEGRFGHRQGWHSLAACLMVTLAAAPLIPLIGIQGWYVIPLGFLSHLVVDLFTPLGVMLAWPFIRTRYTIATGWVPAHSRRSGRALTAALATAAIVLLVAVGTGRTPPARPGPSPSYEATLDRFYSLRGRRLVYANVDGTWQATGRRIADRFEVLNASGTSLIMLDRYTGKVFTAGRNPSDNLYLNGINLQEGTPARVKPVEVELRNQRLVDALPIVYEMEREPGLEHIYVSGDLVLADDQDAPGLTLEQDLAQTRLRRIQDHGDGHFSLHYIAASELIELANVWIEMGELTLVATYASPPTGPTVTPLPSPPPTRLPVLQDG
jgi:membrane-bound metal-dependent hydrolase YbcI (DUF457 family)